MKIPKLRGRLRKPKTKAQSKSLAARDFYRRQQYKRIRGGDITDLCNVYVFTDSNTDRLDFATPFTGNLKILIGGTSTTGINPAIPTTGWINSPDLNPDTLTYNEIESNVLRWVWKLNGTSYGVMPSISVNASSVITAVATVDVGVPYAPLFDSPSNIGRIAARVNASGDGWEFIGLTNATINGSPVSNGSPLPAAGEVFTLVCEPTVASTITRLGVNFATSGFWSGDVRSFAVSGVTNTGTYPSGSLNFELLEPYSDDHQFVDSDNGVVADKFNDLPADYSEVPGSIDYIVDETFNGIVYAYAKDDVWYQVNMGDPTPPVEYENWLMEGDNLLIEGEQVVGIV